MGKKKNDERFQLKTPGSGQKEGNPVKSQAGATETKERANESITELTLLKNPTDKKETPVNKEVLRDYSCNEDDWSSEDDIPDSWEETEAAMRQSRRKESSEQTGKNNSGAQQSKGKQASEESLSIQQESRNGQENKQEEEVNDQDTPTVETTNLGSTMKKMSKIDRYFMKTLLTLAAGTEDKEALLDKLLTDFSKLRSLTLDATRVSAETAESAHDPMMRIEAGVEATSMAGSLSLSAPLAVAVYLQGRHAQVGCFLLLMDRKGLDNHLQAHRRRAAAQQASSANQPASPTSCDDSNVDSPISSTTTSPASSKVPTPASTPAGNSIKPRSSAAMHRAITVAHALTRLLHKIYVRRLMAKVKLDLRQRPFIPADECAERPPLLCQHLLCRLWRLCADRPTGTTVSQSGKVRGLGRKTGGLCRLVCCQTESEEEPAFCGGSSSIAPSDGALFQGSQRSMDEESDIVVHTRVPATSNPDHPESYSASSRHAHKEAYNADIDIERTKPRWTREEEYLTAIDEIQLKGQMMYNINQRLAQKFTSRTFDSIKSHRRDPDYRRLVDDLAARQARSTGMVRDSPSDVMQLDEQQPPEQQELEPRAGATEELRELTARPPPR
ncbi:hypothetical protein HPB49_008996 [Dermacentor silvarum]|uniref:Uncharacterized protein n=1 Tax=Dermacentor silvarum TaxID=543639 RepID=A0ACB8C2R5_DERSI|nr:hypothetical protein HPB49_008996 [Dermacentor silvarum]